MSITQPGACPHVARRSRAQPGSHMEARLLHKHVASALQPAVVSCMRSHRVSHEPVISTHWQSGYRKHVPASATLRSEQRGEHLDVCVFQKQEAAARHVNMFVYAVEQFDTGGAPVTVCARSAQAAGALVQPHDGFVPHSFCVRISEHRTPQDATGILHRESLKQTERHDA